MGSVPGVQSGGGRRWAIADRDQRITGKTAGSCCDKVAMESSGLMVQTEMDRIPQVALRWGFPRELTRVLREVLHPVDRRTEY